MSTQWANEQWSVSPWNFSRETREGLAFPEKIIFSDCTLREGEQQPGVVMNHDDKMALARTLDELGIQQFEVGMPVVSPSERETAASLASAGLLAKTIALCRTRRDEIDMARDCGVWGVSCSLPIGDLQREFKLNWPDEKVIELAVDITNYAHAQGLYVILSPYDTTRTSLDFLQRFLSAVARDGHFDRVRVVDTVGCATPEAIRYLVKLVLELTGRPVEIHCHDDFGLATANVIAGLSAGASVASSSLHGMGERAGNAATEEVALALRILYGIDCGLNLGKLMEASQLLERRTGVRIHDHKSVVGRNCFRYESGIVVAGWAVNRFTTEAYLPEVVGQSSEVLLGKKSGRKSIEIRLDQMGIDYDDELVESLLSRVKDEAIREGRHVSDASFREMIRDLTVGEKPT